MKITVTRDPTLDAFTVRHQGAQLERPEDVAEWRAQLMAEAEAAIGPGKAYLLVDYSGFSVSPRVAEEYGQVAEEFRQRFAREVFRYGAADQNSTSAAILQSIRREHRSNMHGTRQQAIEALTKTRRGA